MLYICEYFAFTNSCSSRNLSGFRGVAMGVLHPPKHLACREIYSTPLVLVDVGTRGKHSLSANLA